jgi:hypothetical protein
MYMHKSVIINKKVYYSGTVYFKKNTDENECFH